MKAKWAGDPKVLPEGAEVLILAEDPEDPDVPSRRACWVRYWPTEFRSGGPMYRSCSYSDLELEEEPST